MKEDGEDAGRFTATSASNAGKFATVCRIVCYLLHFCTKYELVVLNPVCHY